MIRSLREEGGSCGRREGAARREAAGAAIRREEGGAAGNGGVGSLVCGPVLEVCGPVLECVDSSVTLYMGERNRICELSSHVEFWKDLKHIDLCYVGAASRLYYYYSWVPSILTE